MGEAEAARRRLVFDELLRIQLALVMRKRRIEATSQGVAHATGGELVERFLGALPFDLTGDQRKVISEIEAELARPVPRSEEHTSELQSLMRISYAVFCLKKQKQHTTHVNICKLNIN